MKEYKVCFRTTFLKWYKIQAENKDDALKIAEKLIETDDMTDTDMFETEIAEVL